VNFESAKRITAYNYEELNFYYDEDGEAVPYIPSYLPDRHRYKVDRRKLTFKEIALDVSPILQLPELPTGCEITSLTMVLHYLGYSVSNTELAENYLEKSNNYSDFKDKFIGSPFSDLGFGCFENAIVNAADKYLGESGFEYKALKYSGSTFERLLKKVEEGTPVIIWATIGMQRPFYTIVEYKMDEHVRAWIAPEHCMVLIGYNKENSTVLIADPLAGIQEYDMDLVETRYMQMGARAVAIESTDNLSVADAPNFLSGLEDNNIPKR